jgi:hypothetical protein
MGELVDGDDAARSRDCSAQHPGPGGREIPRTHLAMLVDGALSSGKATNKLPIAGRE